MQDWVILFIVILILGALAGGESFGDTIEKGCGCLVIIVLGLVIFAAGRLQNKW